MFKFTKSKLIFYVLVSVFSFIVFVSGFIIHNIQEAAKLTLAATAAKHFNQVNQLKIKHKKELAQVKLKQRAKAKIQRGITAIPLVGISFLALFESIELKEWQEENPEGSFSDYTDELNIAVQALLIEEYNEMSSFSKDILGLNKEPSQ